MEQTQNRNLSLVCVVLIIAVVFGVFGVSFKAVAEENTTVKTYAEEIAEKMFFFGFRKGESESRGKYMIGMIYVPDEVYDATCTYGITLFPRAYMDRFGVYSDYMNSLAEKGKPYLDIVGSVYQPAPEGKIFRCGMSNISDNNLSLVFAFIGYVKDTDGNVAYIEPEFAAYATLNAGEMTDDEIINRLNDEINIRSTFGKIVDKIAELVNSVWIYLVIGCSAVVVVWGAYIGIRIAVAHNNEQKADSKGMLKNLAIGISVMFIIAVALPLLIKGLSLGVD